MYELASGTSNIDSLFFRTFTYECDPQSSALHNKTVLSLLILIVRLPDLCVNTTYDRRYLIWMILPIRRNVVILCVVSALSSHHLSVYAGGVCLECANGNERKLKRPRVFTGLRYNGCIDTNSERRI